MEMRPIFWEMIYFVELKVCLKHGLRSALRWRLRPPIPLPPDSCIGAPQSTSSAAFVPTPLRLCTITTCEGLVPTSCGTCPGRAAAKSLAESTNVSTLPCHSAASTARLLNPNSSQLAAPLARCGAGACWCPTDASPCLALRTPVPTDPNSSIYFHIYHSYSGIDVQVCSLARELINILLLAKNERFRTDLSIPRWLTGVQEPLHFAEGAVYSLVVVLARFSSGIAPLVDADKSRALPARSNLPCFSCHGTLPGRNRAHKWPTGCRGDSDLSGFEKGFID